MGSIAHQTISKITTQKILEGFKAEYMYICIELIRRCFAKDFNLRNVKSSDESLFYMVHRDFFPLVCLGFGTFLHLSITAILVPDLSIHF